MKVADLVKAGYGLEDLKELAKELKDREVAEVCKWYGVCTGECLETGINCNDFEGIISVVWR